MDSARLSTSIVSSTLQHLISPFTEHPCTCKLVSNQFHMFLLCSQKKLASVQCSAIRVEPRVSTLFGVDRVVNARH
jgi:hypothetical protein